MTESGAHRSDTPWDIPDPESSTERRRRQRREYHQRRTRRTADGPEHGRRWTIADARIALDLRRTVPEAAEMLGRSASAVESLRRRWRNGKLPAGLADQVRRPPLGSAAPGKTPELTNTDSTTIQTDRH